MFLHLTLFFVARALSFLFVYITGGTMMTEREEEEDYVHAVPRTRAKCCIVCHSGKYKNMLKCCENK